MLINNENEIKNLADGTIAICEELSTDNNVYLLLKEKYEIAKDFGEKLSLEYCGAGLGTEKCQLYLLLFKINDNIYDLYIDFSNFIEKDLLAKLIVLDKFDFNIYTENGLATSTLNNILREKLKEAYRKVENVYKDSGWTREEYKNTKDMIMDEYSKEELWKMLT